VVDCCIDLGGIEVADCCTGLDEPVAGGCCIPLGPEVVGYHIDQGEKPVGYHSRCLLPDKP
jgi:hypothetical protein